MAISTNLYKGKYSHTLLKPQLAAVSMRWSISNLPSEYHHSYNRSREAGNQPNVRLLQDGTFIWRIPKVLYTMQTKFSCHKKPSFLHSTDRLQDVYRSLPKWERNWLQYPPLIEYDPLLKWPFDYKVTLILVDQTHRRHIWHRFQPDHDNPSFQRLQSIYITAMFCTTSHSSQNYLYSMMDIILCERICM